MTLAYKLLRRRKDGSLGPLFINRKQRISLGTWLKAESHPTNGFALRPGWHCMLTPQAPHLSMKGRVWVEVIVDDFQTHPRPESQGGSWLLAQRMKVKRILV